MKNLMEWIQKALGLSPEVQIKIFASLVISLVLWVLYSIIVKIVWRRTENVRIRYSWGKTSGYVVIILGVFLIGRLWFKGFQSIATYLGLLSAGLAIALKDLVSNFAGWLFIISRRPFSVGDRIQIGNYAGDVIDTRVFQFTLLEIGNWVNADQSTGRIIHIPNGMVLSEVLANYSKGFQYIWNEVPVLITFESNWEKAKRILLKIANTHAEHLSKAAEKRVKEASKKFMILYSKLTPIVYTCVKDSGVLLTIRYLCEPQHRRDSEQAIWEDILKEFVQNKDIGFAYPTQRFYNRRLESERIAKDISEKRDVKKTKIKIES
ncbi:MAG: mechanosensitive ion channel family protein [bacterium]|nr:mechanosensitive ion channel family protein [bacterium]MBU1291451.1 mechanosensitive ion channel family protein [bacterium]MBU1427291.1 mechanosensitive ion channel family protein [bacterium]MBU2439512.1 mechanosensitive ion channel family protein [bacterium]